MTSEIQDRYPPVVLPFHAPPLPAINHELSSVRDEMMAGYELSTLTDEMMAGYELSTVMDEMERLMAEYVDPRHLEPFNVPQTEDLTLEPFLQDLPGIELPSGFQELWTTIVDTGRLILTSISIVLASLAIGLTASITLPMLGVTLFITSTVLLLVSIGGAGLWWTFSGEASRTNHRMDLLRDLRMNKVISQDECWALRKEVTNKWKFRECVGRLAGKLTHQEAISVQEQRALILHLNKGTWNDIDQVLAFLDLRTKLNEALSRQRSDPSVWSDRHLQFVQFLVTVVLVVL